MIVLAGQGDTVEALCYRYLGTTAALVERTLQLNPGLADHGPILPMGTSVVLPDNPSPVAPTSTLVQLWD